MFASESTPNCIRKKSRVVICKTYLCFSLKHGELNLDANKNCFNANRKKHEEESQDEGIGEQRAMMKLICAIELVAFHNVSRSLRLVFIFRSIWNDLNEKCLINLSR